MYQPNSSRSERETNPFHQTPVTATVPPLFRSRGASFQEPSSPGMTPRLHKRPRIELDALVSRVENILSSSPRSSPQAARLSPLAFGSPFGNTLTPNQTPGSAGLRTPSPTEFVSTQQELDTLRTEVLKSRVRKNHTDAELSLERVKYEQTMARHKEERAELEAKIKMLHTELLKHSTTKENEAFRKSENKAEDRQPELDSETESVVTKLRSQVDELHDKLVNAQASSQSKEVDLNSRIKDLEERHARLERELVVATEQANRHEKLAESRIEEVENIQTRLTEVQIKLAKYKMAEADIEANKEQLEHLQGQMERARSLEEENRKLFTENRFYKDVSPSITRLKQERDSMETRLIALRRLNQEKARVEADNARLRQEKAEWTSFLESGEVQFASPARLCRDVAAARAEKKTLEERIELLKQQLRSNVTATAEQEAQIRRLSNERDAFQVELAWKRKEWQEQQKLLQQEVEMYKRLGEYAVKEQQLVQSDYNAEHLATIESLQKLLDQYKQLQQNAGDTSEGPSAVDMTNEEALTQVKLHSEEMQYKNEELNAELDKLKTEHTILSQEVASLQQQMDLLKQSEELKHARELKVLERNHELETGLMQLTHKNSRMKQHIATLEKELRLLGHEPPSAADLLSDTMTVLHTSEAERSAPQQSNEAELQLGVTDDHRQHEWPVSPTVLPKEDAMLPHSVVHQTEAAKLHVLPEVQHQQQQQPLVLELQQQPGSTSLATSLQAQAVMQTIQQLQALQAVRGAAISLSQSQTDDTHEQPAVAPTPTTYINLEDSDEDSGSSSESSGLDELAVMHDNASRWQEVLVVDDEDNNNERDISSDSESDELDRE